MHDNISARLEAQARRTARRAGLVARKTRWRAGTIDNLGLFRLIDPFMNAVVAGERYDMTAQEVIDYCQQ